MKSDLVRLVEFSVKAGLVARGLRDGLVVESPLGQAEVEKIAERALTEWLVQRIKEEIT